MYLRAIPNSESDSSYRHQNELFRANSEVNPNTNTAIITDHNTLGDILISFAFFVVIISALLPCLSFIKRSLRCVFGPKVKKAVRSKSVLSSDSTVMSDNPHNHSAKDCKVLSKHLEDLLDNSAEKLNQEFDDLKIKENPSTIAAELPANRLKNRFANILPYDSTRVILNEVDNIEGSDFINANFISGLHSPKEYIATQGPLKTTVHDFWRMCWQTNSRAIIMLTRCIDKDKEKCYKYWPSGSLPEEYDEIEVEIENEVATSHLGNQWVTRDLILRKENEERSVKHFHFVTWPDFGAVEPESSLLQFITNIRAVIPFPPEGAVLDNSSIHPIIVHCSAGVGRSGTFVAIDTCMKLIKDNKEVDIFGIVHKMRTQRVWMVQSATQYLSIYMTVLEFWRTQLKLQTTHSDSDIDANLTEDPEDV